MEPCEHCPTKFICEASGRDFTGCVWLYEGGCFARSLPGIIRELHDLLGHVGGEVIGASEDVCAARTEATEDAAKLRRVAAAIQERVERHLEDHGRRVGRAAEDLLAELRDLRRGEKQVPAGSCAEPTHRIDRHRLTAHDPERNVRSLAKIGVGAGQVDIDGSGEGGALNPQGDLPDVGTDTRTPSSVSCIDKRQLGVDGAGAEGIARGSSEGRNRSEHDYEGEDECVLDRPLVRHG